MRSLMSFILAASMATVPAFDPPDTGGERGEVFQHDNTRGVVLRNSKIVLSGNGLGAKSDGYRVKRPCWYEPAFSAEEMIKRQQRVKDWVIHTNPTEETFDQFMEQFKDKVGQDGRWWEPAYNERDPDGYSCWSGLLGAVWVPTGTTPQGGITLQELYQLARAAVTVPEPKIELSPAVKSYVNLPTFVWLTGVAETTRSVTAEIPGVMSATVTATLTNLKIKSGAGSGRAQVKQNCGPTGHPYTEGATFDCGVRYLRASIDQPRKTYPLTVTTVWPVTADGGVNFAFQPVQVSAVRDVPVGEVQSTVRQDSTGKS